MWLVTKRLRFMLEQAISKGEEVATNGIGLGIEFESKKSKVWSSKIKVVMCVNKMAHP